MNEEQETTTNTNNPPTNTNTNIKTNTDTHVIKVHDNDSDNDEGFVPTKVEIKSDLKLQNKNNKNDTHMERPIDFQARYIYGDGIIRYFYFFICRKEPVESYARFRKFLSEHVDVEEEEEEEEKMEMEEGNYSELCIKTIGEGNKNISEQKERKLEKELSLGRKEDYMEEYHSIDHNKYNKNTSINYQSLSIPKQPPSSLLNPTESNPQDHKTITSINFPELKLQPQLHPQLPFQSQSPEKEKEKEKQSHKTTIEPPLHPYEKFIKSELYTLVYSRIKVCNFNLNNDDFSNNEINLSKVIGKYDADYYSVLKGFEYGGLAIESNNTMGYCNNNNNDRNKHESRRSREHNNHHHLNNINNREENLEYSYKNAQETETTNENTSFRIRSQTNNSEHRMNNNSNYIHHQQQPQHQLHNNLSNSHNSNHTHTHSHTHPNTEELEFDSKFESGNLLYAFKHKIQSHSYYLFIQNDTNSNGYNQWFYFSLRNMKSNIPYKFTIRKKHSLFKEGMKISVWSYIDSCQEENEGIKIYYRYREWMEKISDKKYKFYSLSFELRFRNEGDYVKIAMNVPYSYSRLIYHLRICENIVKRNNEELEREKEREKEKEKEKEKGEKYSARKLSSKLRSGRKGNIMLEKGKSDKAEEMGVFWEMVPVGYSIANNAVPYITITSNKNKPQAEQIISEEQKEQKEEQLEQREKPEQNLNKEPENEPKTPKELPTPKKKALIFLSRQHPGETWSSFQMEELIYALSENKSESTQYLLENYIIKIFPMVNVDGVIYGNFRCDIGGFDLNRNWRNPDKNLHPQVYAIKNEIEKIAEEYEIECVLDLHGHSKQYNTFSYACKNDPITARVLSLLISEINPLFHFPYCTFGISRYKETTARAVIYKITGNENILTIENSFYAAKLGDKLLIYNPEIMREIVDAILEAMYRYFTKNKHRIECEQKIRENMQEYIKYEKYVEKSAAVDSGSESEPYIDEISIKDKIKKILPKSFKALEQQLEEEEKIIHKKPSPTKKRLIEKKSPSTNQNYKTINPNPTNNPSALKKTRKHTQEEEQEPPQTFIERTSLTHYKRNSKELPKKETPTEIKISQQTNRPSNNSIEYEPPSLKPKFGDIGLPFYLREKSTLVPIKLKNDSLEIFKDAYNATKLASEYESNLHRTFNKSSKNSNKKVKILNQSKNQINEEFPILCVLSEEKKRHSQNRTTNIFLEEEKERNMKDKDKIAISLPPKIKVFVQNEKLEHIKKSNREKNNSMIQNANLDNTNTKNDKTNYNSANNNRNINELKSELTKEHKSHNTNTNGNSNSNGNGSGNGNGSNKDASLISKIWRENFARYGKDLNIFFGGMKGG